MSYTGKNSQLVLMSLRPKEEIGEETHTLDQFIRVEAGDGVAILDGVKHQISDGSGSPAVLLLRHVRLGIRSCRRSGFTLGDVCRLEATNEEGVISYLENDRGRGVLLRNVWEQVEAARQLIAGPGPFAVKDLEGRLPAKTSSPKPDS